MSIYAGSGRKVRREQSKSGTRGAREQPARLRQKAKVRQADERADGTQGVKHAKLKALFGRKRHGRQARVGCKSAAAISQRRGENGCRCPCKENPHCGKQRADDAKCRPRRCHASRRQENPAKNFLHRLDRRQNLCYNDLTTKKHGSSDGNREPLPGWKQPQ